MGRETARGDTCVHLQQPPARDRGACRPSQHPTNSNPGTLANAFQGWSGVSSSAGSCAPCWGVSTKSPPRFLEFITFLFTLHRLRARRDRRTATHDYTRYTVPYLFPCRCPSRGRSSPETRVHLRHDSARSAPRWPPFVTRSHLKPVAPLARVTHHARDPRTVHHGRKTTTTRWIFSATPSNNS